MIAFFGFLRHLKVFGNKSRQAKLQLSLTPTNNNSDSSSSQAGEGEGEHLLQGVGNTCSIRETEHEPGLNQKDRVAPHYANADDSHIYPLGLEKGMPFLCCPTPYAPLGFIPQKVTFKL